MTDIIERLIQDHQQLRKMSEAACFAGKETGVRVKDPSALLEDLDDAVAEITKLRAERDAFLAKAAPGLDEDGMCNDHGVFGCKRCIGSLGPSFIATQREGVRHE